MKIYVGVTDKEWYEQLRQQRPEEVNFWKPGSSNFRALQENDMFLFKLHHPYNYIVGGGFFVRFSLVAIIKQPTHLVILSPLQAEVRNWTRLLIIKSKIHNIDFRQH